MKEFALPSIRFVLLAVGLLALEACADNPPSYIARTDKLSEIRLRKEYNDDIHGQDFAVLGGKVHMAENFHHDQPACLGLISDGYPTPAEAAALRRWIELRTAYYLGSEALQIHAAAVSEKAIPIVHRYVDTLDDGLKRSTALISDLADGKMTYCQFAEADKSVTEAVLAQAAPLHAEMILTVTRETHSDSSGSGTDDLHSARPDTLPVVHNGMDINTGFGAPPR